MCKYLLSYQILAPHLGIIQVAFAGVNVVYWDGSEKGMKKIFEDLHSMKKPLLPNWASCDNTSAILPVSLIPCSD